MKLSDLTVNERILLHLRDYMGNTDTTSASMGQTQAGISEGIDIRINHIPRAVKKLLDDNYVNEYLAHVSGLKRKRKVYYLNEAGVKKASQMLDEIKDQEISLTFKDGQTSQIKISDISLTIKTEATLPQLILHAFSHGSIYESKLGSDHSNETSYVSNLSTIPDTPDMIGRSEQQDWLGSFIDGGRNVTIISGIKAVGKTTLVRKTLDDYEGNRNILWFTANEWDNVRTFMEAMSDLLSRVDRGEVRRMLRSSRDIDPTLAFPPFLKDVLGLDPIIVIDNIFNLQKELMHLIMMIMSDASKFDSTHFILITRDIETLKAGLTRNMDRFTLEGLTPIEVKSMISSNGLEISDEDLDIIYSITNGHPMAIDLIVSELAEASFDTKGLTHKELLMVKCLKAFDSIFQ